MTKPIVLVGLPGSGKTTIGRQLARRLGLAFVDCDQVLEERLGMSIRDIFARMGEEGFRDHEQALLAELLHRPATVLSTGGGCVLRSANRAAMRTHGWVVYLKSSPQALAKRLQNDQTRPLLQVADPLKKLRQLYQQRDPLYREIAHHTLETGRPSVNTLVNHIAMQLELQALSAPALALPASPPVAAADAARATVPASG